MKITRENIIEEPGKWLNIIIISFLAIVLLLIVTQYNISKLYLRNGIIDLQATNFDQNVMRLDGYYHFYDNQLVNKSPDSTDFKNETLLKVGSWNKQKEKYQIKSFGYGTYHFKLINSPIDQLGLDLGQINSAYNIWVNNELVESVGKVGRSKSSYKPRINANVVSVKVLDKETDIYIEVANFDQAKGGIIQPIYLGSIENVNKLREKALLKEMFILAIFFASFFINSSIFIIGVRNRNYFVIALLAIANFIRHSAGSVFPVLVVFPDVSVYWVLVMNNVGLYLSFAMGAMLVRNANKGIFNHSIVNIVIYYALGASIICVVLPGWWVFYISLVFYITSFLILLYAIIIFFGYIKNRYLQNVAFWSCLAVLSIFLFHDILAMLEIIPGEYFEIYGIVIMFAVQSIYLNYRYKFTSSILFDTSKDISKVGIISKTQVAKINTILEELKDLYANLENHENKKQLKHVMFELSNHFLESDEKITLDHIETINEVFFTDLRKRFPHLTKSEIEFCGYLRADFSSKKIAEIKNITPLSVKRAKNRLRKKLNIDSEKDIYQFIKSI